MASSRSSPLVTLIKDRLGSTSASSSSPKHSSNSQIRCDWNQYGAKNHKNAIAIVKAIVKQHPTGNIRLRMSTDVLHRIAEGPPPAMLFEYVASDRRVYRYIMPHSKVPSFVPAFIQTVAGHNASGKLSSAEKTRLDFLHFMMFGLSPPCVAPGKAIGIRFNQSSMDRWTQKGRSLHDPTPLLTPFMISGASYCISSDTDYRITETVLYVA
jgi:hypothetical protein